MVWNILYFKVRLCMLLSEWRILPLEAGIDLCYLLIGYRPTCLLFFFSLRCQFNRFWQWKFSFQIETWSHATVSVYDPVSEVENVSRLVLRDATCVAEVSWCRSEIRCLNLEHSLWLLNFETCISSSVSQSLTIHNVSPKDNWLLINV